MKIQEAEINFSIEVIKVMIDMKDNNYYRWSDYINKDKLYSIIKYMKKISKNKTTVIKILKGILKDE